MVEGMAAVDAAQVMRTTFGYDWTMIQRKRDADGRKKIFLDRPLLQDGRYKSSCMFCNDPARGKNGYCSPACKAADRPHAPSADIIRDLVTADYYEASVRDSFCPTCSRAYSSAHCNGHAVHQPGDGQQAGAAFEAAADGAEPGAAPEAVHPVIHLVEYDGWRLIPAHIFGNPMPVQLQTVKTILVDGVQMVPLRRRLVPDAEGGHHCARDLCSEVVDAPDGTCCLDCCFHVQQQAQD